MISLLTFGPIACRPSGSSGIGATAPGASSATIASIFPEPGAADVALDESVYIVFTKPMSARTIDRKSLLLLRDGEPVSGKVSAQGIRASFRPDLELQPGSTYEIVVTRDVRDANERPLESEHRARFSTIAAGPFQLLRTSPRDGQQSVSRDVVISADFSDFVDPASVTSDSVRLIGPDGVLSATRKVNGRTISLVPTGLLTQETEYRVVWKSDIRSIEGDAVGEDTLVDFVTIPRLGIVGIAPPDGAIDVPVDSRVRIEFTENIDSQSIEDASLRLSSPLGDVAGRLIVDGRFLTFDPDFSLRSQIEYSLQLASDIRSVSGDELGDSEAVSFVTELIPIPPVLYVHVGSEVSTNHVVAFSLDTNGSLQPDPRVISVAGQGTGNHVMDTLTVTPTQEYLFVSGVRTPVISSYRILSEGDLQLVEDPIAFPASTTSPLLVAPDGQTLYAGNSGIATISILQISSEGRLQEKHPAASTASSNTFSFAMDSKGDRLYLGFGDCHPTVQVFDVIADGDLRPALELTGGTSCEIALMVDRSNDFLLAGDWANAGERVWDLRKGTSDSQIPGSPFDDGSATMGPIDSALSVDGRFLYVSYRNSSHVSGFEIQGDGSVTHVPGSPFNLSSGASAVAVSPTNVLYVCLGSSLNVAAFRIESNGSLTKLGPDRPVGVTGSHLIGAVALGF
ncbi:MAG: Ig-like domain-containing protein [Planctomycetota bacterium]